jgi:hypothetical protein
MRVAENYLFFELLLPPDFEPPLFEPLPLFEPPLLDPEPDLLPPFLSGISRNLLAKFAALSPLALLNHLFRALKCFPEYKCAESHGLFLVFAGRYRKFHLIGFGYTCVCDP